ncbi:thioredoxin-like 1-1, chloroplastic isoform X1 [Tasmannia lanceolata]|uniref:thioredoxin-like 1-1, chloroplastic isoform X1 n=1 Tax=Tasmannia lanceolata TaxID=3420 RepID=UPI0040630629
MAVSLRSGFDISNSSEFGFKKKRFAPFSYSEGFQKLILKSDFKGRQVVLSEEQSSRGHANFAIHAKKLICISRALRWWEKSPKPNMKEIKSAQELVNSLLNAGDNLVIINFYLPGCGGCKALHPKICQFAESNPNIQFLQVNCEEHRSMCCSLHIHVLPFFRFYRGAQGCLCRFSCTNATIKKFKDALAKHGSDRCSLGPAKGLEESELLILKEKFGVQDTNTCNSSSIIDNPMEEETEEENAAYPVSIFL